MIALKSIAVDSVSDGIRQLPMTALQPGCCPSRSRFSAPQSGLFASRSGFSRTQSGFCAAQTRFCGTESRFHDAQAGLFVSQTRFCATQARLFVSQSGFYGTQARFCASQNPDCAAQNLPEFTDLPNFRRFSTVRPGWTGFRAVPTRFPDGGTAGNIRKQQQNNK